MSQKGITISIDQIVVWILLAIGLILILRVKIKGFILFFEQRKRNSEKKDDKTKLPPLSPPSASE